MAYKRPSDAVALIPEAKRTRSEMAEYTNRDKALMEIVSIGCRISTEARQCFSHLNEFMNCHIFRELTEHPVYLHQLCNWKDTKVMCSLVNSIQRENI